MSVKRTKYEQKLRPTQIRALYTMKKRYVVMIAVMTLAWVMTSGLQAKEIDTVRVSGIVTDHTGLSMPGVNITIKGTNNGTTSDINGKFSLSVSENTILRFSFVYCVSQEIAVGMQREFNVKMEASNTETSTGSDLSNEYLVPVEGFYDAYDFSFEYGSKLRQVLFDGLDDRPIIRFQVMPSFTPESVLDIEFDRKNDKYYMNYHIGEQMIYRNQDSLDKVKINRFRTGIDKESVDLIKSLFDIAITQVRYPEIKKTGEVTIMFDGTGYYFTLGWDGYSLRSGHTRSPSGGSKMKRLVEIGYQLIELAKSKKEITKMDERLQEEIEELIDELK